MALFIPADIVGCIASYSASNAKEAAQLELVSSAWQQGVENNEEMWFAFQKRVWKLSGVVTQTNGTKGAFRRRIECGKLFMTRHSHEAFLEALSRLSPIEGVDIALGTCEGHVFVESMTLTHKQTMDEESGKMQQRHYVTCNICGFEAEKCETVKDAHRMRQASKPFYMEVPDLAATKIQSLRRCLMAKRMAAKKAEAKRIANTYKVLEK